MKTKQIKKQLALNKKTIAGLNDNEKSDVLGGSTLTGNYCSSDCYASIHARACDKPYQM